MNYKANKLCLYAKCLYYKDGCGKYKFVINLSNTPYSVTTFATHRDIIHPSKSKRHQLRGIRRDIAKHDIKHLKATNWRDTQINLQSKHLNKVGNNQCVLSKDAARRLKFEQARSLDRDADSHIDVCKMYMEEKWRNIIAKVSLPQELFLISKKQIQILHLKNSLLLKMSRNTLFFDATGSVIKKYESQSKRVFLYTLVAHIPQGDKKKGVLLPVAEAFFYQAITLLPWQGFYPS